MIVDEVILCILLLNTAIYYFLPESDWSLPLAALVWVSGVCFAHWYDGRGLGSPVEQAIFDATYLNLGVGLATCGIPLVILHDGCVQFFARAIATFASTSTHPHE
jgi:hypothetical protein